MMKYLPKFIQITLTVIWEQVLAFFAGPVALMLYSLSLRLPKPSKQGQPIVLVPGLLNAGLSFWLLHRRLARQGFSVHVVPLGANVGDARKSSKKLKDHMEAHNLSDIVMVGFSLSGLIGLWYLQHLGGWSRVERFISVAAPLKGAPLARVMSWSSKVYRQLIPGSNYLKELHSEYVKHPELMVCISAIFDSKVPRWSSQLEGVKHEVADTYGHTNSLLFSRKTFELILKRARK